MNVAIILAAGESRRMGKPKQLLPFDGKTMLECVIDAFVSPRIDRTLVVLGYKADEIARQITATVVRNPNYARGMFTSVQAGLRALPKGTKLVLIAVGDQPKLKRATVEKLVETFEREKHKILVPSIHGRQGHPLLLSARYVKDILALDEKLTLKHFLANHPDDLARLVVDDEGVFVDIDDRADYEREMRGAQVPPREGTRPATADGPTQDVVGRVPSRGAGTRVKPPRRLRRLDSIWVGDRFPCFFLTICVQGRAQVLANERIHVRLREFLRTSGQRYGWWPGRYVIMPDHIHLLVAQGEAPRGGTRPTTVGDWVNALKAVVGQRRVRWQKSFFDHALRSDESAAEKGECIRQNPVRAGLVGSADEWPYTGEISCERNGSAA